MWRRGNAPSNKTNGQWFEFGQVPFFLQAKNRPLVFCLSAFFVGLVTAAPILPKIWQILIELKNFSVYSGFGQVIESQEVLPIFAIFYIFFSCCLLKISEKCFQGVFCGFSAVVTLMLETKNPRSSISVGTCFFCRN